jgi:hypothetical protein
MPARSRTVRAGVVTGIPRWTVVASGGSSSTPCTVIPDRDLVLRGTVTSTGVVLPVQNCQSAAAAK